MGNRCHDASAVACILFEATAAAVVHSGIDVVGVRQNFMAGYAFDMGDKAHTTGIFFEGRVVETVFGGKSDFAVNSLVHHAINSFGGAISNRQVIQPSKK